MRRVARMRRCSRMSNSRVLTDEHPRPHNTSLKETTTDTGTKDDFGDADRDESRGKPVSKQASPSKREQAAARIDSLYRQMIPNPYNRKFGPKQSIKRIAALLKSEATEQQLSDAVKRYAREAMKNDPEHRKGIRGFFSDREGMWQGYLTEDDPGQGDRPSSDNDYELSADDVVAIEAWETEQARKAANA